MDKFGSKKSKLSILPENWQTWYLRMLIIIAILFFWISYPKSIFGQIWAKKSKLSILPENCHTCYLRAAASKCRLRFFKFWPQNSILGRIGLKKSQFSVLPDNSHTWYLILNLKVDFQNSNPKIHFWTNLHQKSIPCLFLICDFTAIFGHTASLGFIF